MIIDEFLGSGQTMIGRVNQLKNDLKDSGEVEIKFCFLAGMKFAIKNIQEQGYEVYCAIQLDKAISEKYQPKQRKILVTRMENLEAKLKNDIDEFDLNDFKFGYNRAEALYSLEGCQGNTPNSVFPIFWWPRDVISKERKTLLVRYQKGLI
jgi:hypothetical protein